jgi:fructose-bisphosphate aldolase, class I
MMSKITQTVRKILSFYESDTPGVKNNLARLLGHGRLGGTGRLIILPVDQGFEHGPVRSFSMNKPAFDPHYHYQLAVDAGVSAYAAPLGALEAGASTFAGRVPTILKMNSGNTLANPPVGPDQAVTASIQDALRLGCSGIGFTIYPGSDATYDMYEEIRDLSAEAKDCGLFTVIWSYPRGAVSKKGETAVDVISYGAHMAALLGAHIIKVKLPTDHVETPEAQKAYAENGIAISSLKDRVSHVVQSCFNGRRLVVFSGGAAQSIEDVYQEARAIRDGGGHGSIIGRNSFQRPHDEAVQMLKELGNIYRSS